MKRSRKKEKGAALILAMIFVAVLTIMGVSMMFLSQSETWSSLNYRLMTQARYGAEAGIHVAADYLTNGTGTGYTPPGGAGDPLIGYNMNVSPVTPAVANGNPVYLGFTMNGVSANYPAVSSVTSAFNTATTGSVPAGSNTVNYTVNAELMSMRQIQQCGNSQFLTAQTWKITSHGDIAGVRNAEAEVSAVLEQQVLPCYNYAAFATGNGCGSINFNAGGTIDSYDSASYVAGTFQPYDGNLGSNGNLNTGNGTVVNGTFSSPRVGGGSTCVNGGVEPPLTGGTAPTGCENSAQVSAGTCGSTCTQNCGATVVPLSQAQTFVPPVTDYPGCTGAGAAACDNTTAASLGGSAPSPLTPGPYGDLSGNKNFILTPSGTFPNCSAGVYYINSITLKGNGQVTVSPCLNPDGTPTSQYFPIIVNLVGANGAAPLTLVGNGLNNPSMNAAMVQFLYSGTGTITLKGNGSSAGVLYAPQASALFTGNGTWYGSMIVNKVDAKGNPMAIHYDRRLADDLYTVGNWTLNSFTWSRF
jgi:hypothetical protein